MGECVKMCYMQTFLPYSSFEKTARVLDNKRLGKQRVEALQILRALNGEYKSGAWTNHPATNMWRESERVLVDYGLTICKEWKKRGFQDTCLEKISSYKKVFRKNKKKPLFLGKRKFHLSHRSNLTRKLPEYYNKFWNVPNNIPYLWIIKKN